MKLVEYDFGIEDGGSRLKDVTEDMDTMILVTDVGTFDLSVVGNRLRVSLEGGRIMAVIPQASNVIDIKPVSAF